MFSEVLITNVQIMNIEDRRSRSPDVKNSPKWCTYSIRLLLVGRSHDG